MFPRPEPFNRRKQATGNFLQAWWFSVSATSADSQLTVGPLSPALASFCLALELPAGLSVVSLSWDPTVGTRGRRCFIAPQLTAWHGLALQKNLAETDVLDSPNF